MLGRSPTTQLFNSPHAISLPKKTIFHFLLSLLPMWYMPHISKTTMIPHAAVITSFTGEVMKPREATLSIRMHRAWLRVQIREAGRSRSQLEFILQTLADIKVLLR